MRWPRSLKRAESSPAPMKTTTASASAAACNQRGREIMEDFISVPCSHMRRSTNRRSCGNLDGGGIRHQCDDGAEDHDDQADPNPRDQRIQVRFNDGPSGGLVLTFIDQIDVAHQKEIFAEAGINPGECLRLLAGFIEAALRI